MSLPTAEAPSALDERAGVAGAKVRTDTTEAQRKDASIGSTVEAAPAVVAPSVTNAAPMAEKRDADPTPVATLCQQTVQSKKSCVVVCCGL